MGREIHLHEYFQLLVSSIDNKSMQEIMFAVLGNKSIEKIMFAVHTFMQYACCLLAVLHSFSTLYACCLHDATARVDLLLCACTRRHGNAVKHQIWRGFHAAGEVL